MKITNYKRRPMSCWLYRSEESLEHAMKITTNKRRPMSCWLYRSEE